MSSLGACDAAWAALASGHHPHGDTPAGLPEMEFPLLSSEEVEPLFEKDRYCMEWLTGLLSRRWRLEIQGEVVKCYDWSIPGGQMTFDCDVGDQLISKDSGLLTLIVADAASVRGCINFSISWLTEEHSTCTETTAATFVPTSQLEYRMTWREAWDATLGRSEGNAASHAVQGMVDAITRKQAEQSMGEQNVLALFISGEVVEGSDGVQKVYKSALPHILREIERIANGLEELLFHIPGALSM